MTFLLRSICEVSSDNCHSTAMTTTSVKRKIFGYGIIMASASRWHPMEYEDDKLQLTRDSTDIEKDQQTTHWQRRGVAASSIRTWDERLGSKCRPTAHQSITSHPIDTQGHVSKRAFQDMMGHSDRTRLYGLTRRTADRFLDGYRCDEDAMGCQDVKTLCQIDVSYRRKIRRETNTNLLLGVAT